MTLFAGVFSKIQDTPPSEALCSAIRDALSRSRADQPTTHRSERLFLAKVDVGVFGSAGLLVSEDGAVSALAGEPLLGSSAGPSLSADRDRFRDLALLHESWRSGRSDLLAGAGGTFCAVHHTPPDRLSLFTDRLGVHPLYFAEWHGFVLFSTALRVFESVPGLLLAMDVRAVSEMTALGYPLGRRTAYHGVRCLHAAERVQFAGERRSEDRYWRWNTIEPTSRSEEDHRQHVYERFRSAVRRRLRKAPGAVAFLSGGLDSRCIVSALRDDSTAVDTFNFAAAGTQDQVFASLFAREVGTRHHESPRPGPWNLEEATLARAMGETLDRLDTGGGAGGDTRRGRIVWSGEGGSVGLGHVYLTERMVKLARAGRWEEAVDHFLEVGKRAVTGRIIRRGLRDPIISMPREGILEEVAGIHCTDPARALYLFLMFNDQRRHLSGHFEHIDLHRIELQLPFFDGGFLEAVLAVPIDLCLGHRFYLGWLERFPPTVMSVPWQAYPGHEPCPLPYPETLSHQWQPEQLRRVREAARERLLEQVDELGLWGNFPSPLLSWGQVKMLSWVYRAKLRDVGYAVSDALSFQRVWNQTDGRFHLE